MVLTAVEAKLSFEEKKSSFEIKLLKQRPNKWYLSLSSLTQQTCYLGVHCWYVFFSPLLVEFNIHKVAERCIPTGPITVGSTVWEGTGTAMMSTGKSTKLRGIPTVPTGEVRRGQAEVESTVIRRGGGTVKTSRTTKGGERARWGGARPPQIGALWKRKGGGWPRTKRTTNTDIWLRGKRAGNCRLTVQTFTRPLIWNKKKISKVGKERKAPVTDTTRSLCTGNDTMMHNWLDTTTTETIVKGPGTVHVRGHSH